MMFRSNYRATELHLPGSWVGPSLLVSPCWSLPDRKICVKIENSFFLEPSKSVLANDIAPENLDQAFHVGDKSGDFRERAWVAACTGDFLLSTKKDQGRDRVEKTRQNVRLGSSVYGRGAVYSVNSRAAVSGSLVPWLALLNLQCK
ncbi:hypothetical protein SADUNF_Sadunf03G0131000 [Salix dunnii]|uniref:Uncharacterized protein n=1 Tax=Salix dunnii TaxID=1413687 RepID=A0A835N4M3_9ROSI|nr:hypothetical protein SADUNF_Sadunf03G0131000 [Salix dunnii]